MIRFENVCKSYKNTNDEVVKNVSFEIEKGKLVVLIGPSGCGKTTCLKMINRLEKISSGKIFINEKSNEEYDPIELRRSMGYVIQQIGLFPHMTIRDNIEIIQRLSGIENEKIVSRTSDLMKMISLDEDYLNRYPTQLSGGQLQRIGVARAFAMDPEIILMDEPFSALDPLTRTQLQDELIFIQNRIKKTIVFVTHDMNEAIKLADKICIMKNGSIVQYDTPENIMKYPKDDYVSNFVGRNRIWSNPKYIHARDIMIENPFVVPEEMPLIRCIEQMRIKHVTSAMVLDDNDDFIGIVKGKDVQSLKNKEIPVKDVCEYPGVVAHEKDNLFDLISIFDREKLTYLPVLNDLNKLIGIITQSSLVTALSQQYMNSEEVNNNA